MYYVYVLKQKDQHRFYTGSTTNLKRRLAEHKSNINNFTKDKKWNLYCYFVFKNESMARGFEQYLKTGSGRAFSKKHFEF